jgi:hypothetical protein
MKQIPQQNERRNSLQKRAKRRKPSGYTKSVYGARLKHEDARIIDDYVRSNESDRTTVVRLALHQFALRQQMLFDGDAESDKQPNESVAAQLSDIKMRLEEMFALTAEMANFMSEGHSSPAQFKPSAREYPNVSHPITTSDNRVQVERLFIRQQQLLEAVLAEAVREIVARFGKRFLSELNTLSAAEIS